MHSRGPRWPKTQLGHEAGSSGSCRRDGRGRLGRVCCSRLAGRRQKPEQAEGVQLVNAIYTMYKRVISPLSWQRPHQVQVPQQEKGHQSGRAGSSNTFLALKGKRGGSADGASRYKKRGEDSLNNGTKLRLSRGTSEGLGLGEGAVQSLQWTGALAAAFLSFTVFRELHHVVLLLLLLFRQVVFLCS